MHACMLIRILMQGLVSHCVEFANSEILVAFFIDVMHERNAREHRDRI